MPTITITDDFIDALADKIAEKLNSVEPAAGAGEDEADEGAGLTQKEFLAIVDEAAKASSKKEVMAVLAEFDCKNPKKADEEDWDDIAEQLSKLIDSDEEDEEEEDDEELDEDDNDDEEESDDDEEEDEEDITPEDVKEAYTAAKKKDSKATKEIMADFELKSPAGFKKLDEDELVDIYEELADVAEL